MVILLLGILALSVTPLDSYRTFNLEMAALRVTQDLHYAHELAAIKNTNCGILFNVNGTYTVYEGTSATPATDPLRRQPAIIDLGTLFKNVQILSNVQFEFDPLGRPVTGGGQTVQVGDGIGTVTLLVTANTGIVQRQ